MRAGEIYAAISVEDPVLHELGERIGICLRHIAMLDADIIVRGSRKGSGCTFTLAPSC